MSEAGQPDRGQSRRRAHLLVVVDESPEMRKALRYACRRAKRTGGRVAMLYVLDPPERPAMGRRGRPDAPGSAPAGRAGDRPARRYRGLVDRPAAHHPYPGGKSRDELIKLLTEDRSISVLVLGSASSGEVRVPWSPRSPASSAASFASR